MFTLFQAIADFSSVTRSEADKANGTLEVTSVTADTAYICEATVEDMNGDSHVLRSNSIIVKVVSQDMTNVVEVTEATEKTHSSLTSYITEVPCAVSAL